MTDNRDQLPIIIDYDGTAMSDDAVRELIEENKQNMLNPDFEWPTEWQAEDAALFRKINGTKFKESLQ